MAGGLKWDGPSATKAVRSEASGRIRAACVYLSSAVKADITQPGTLRYHPRTKKGKPSKSQRTIYNFTHSRPGNPPYKQTGHLRRSIAWEASGLRGRVGSNLKYARYLELGTRTMAARPFLRAALAKHRATIAAILAGKLGAGQAPAIGGFQFRSGHFGAGARKAGFA